LRGFTIIGLYVKRRCVTNQPCR